MANLYKPRYTRTDPKTGEQVAKRVKKWYARYYDADGVRQQVALSEDKQTAHAMLGEIIRRVEREKAGITDPHNDQLQQSVETNIEDFLFHLESKQRSEKHVSETIRNVKNVVAACRFQILAELQFGDEPIQRHLVDRKQEGASHRTVNADLSAIRGFCRWLLKRERILRDPTISIDPLNESEDRRLERRALSGEEAQKLIATTIESEKIFRHLDGPQRAMLYLLALRTGLRRNELRSLTPSSFNLESKVPSVSLHASDSKRRKQDCLPIPKDIAKLYQVYLLEKDPDEPVWPGSWWRRSAEMIRKDLEAANIPVKDEQGRIVDFHGQRTTFITDLSRAGVIPAFTQKLARHSDIKLTMGTYTSMGLEELGSAVESLPALTPCDNKQQTTNPEPLSAEQLSRLNDVWAQLREETKYKIMGIVEKSINDGT